MHDFWAVIVDDDWTTGVQYHFTEVWTSVIRYFSGKNVTIKGSHLWDNVTVEDNCVIDTSVLCSDVVVYEGVRLSPCCVLASEVRLVGRRLEPFEHCSNSCMPRQHDNEFPVSWWSFLCLQVALCVAPAVYFDDPYRGHHSVCPSFSPLSVKRAHVYTLSHGLFRYLG